MRYFAMVALVFTGSAALAAEPAPRPALASDPLYSAGQVTDVDPAGTSEEAALYGALQGLIERYGVTGVSYTDKSVHKDWTITADEAKLVLLSFYDQLSMLVSASADEALAKASDDDAAKVIKNFQTLTDVTLAPAENCPLLVGTKYAAAPKKGKAAKMTKPVALAGKATVNWTQGLGCLPGGGSMPQAARSYNLKPAKPQSPMTRGEFLHKLNEAAESSMAEIGLLME